MKTTVLLICGLVSAAQCAWSQGTSFTYQGHLGRNGVSANGSYDLQFALYEAVNGGNQIRNSLTNSAVGVSSGLFTVQLDFGSGAFNGSAR